MIWLKWMRPVTAGALAVAALSCADDRDATVERGEASYYDGNINDFLPDYIDEHPLFLDDDLEFWVKEGRVSARGTLDSEDERRQLEYRLRRIPAVRDVDLSGVKVP
jgi:hypothetical protein